MECEAIQSTSSTQKCLIVITLSLPSFNARRGMQCLALADDISEILHVPPGVAPKIEKVGEEEEAVTDLKATRITCIIDPDINMAEPLLCLLDKLADALRFTHIT